MLGKRIGVLGLCFVVGMVVVLGYVANRGTQGASVEGRSIAKGATPFDGLRAYKDLERIVGIGPRVPGTEGIRRVRELIGAGLRAAGLNVQEYPFRAQTPLGVIEMVNMVGVVAGTEDGVIIIGNHYDTKYFADIQFVGANDGGSTTAWLLEFARAVGPSREGMTLWLCFYDGEEAFEEWTATDSLYGSREMVRRLEDEGSLKEVRAVVNVDMVGDCALGIFKDRGAPSWLSRIIWSQAEALSYGEFFSPVSRAVQDDHLPFRNAGIAAINLIDFSYGGGPVMHRRNWHTSEDTLDKVCAESLQAVGDVIYSSLGRIEGEVAVVSGE